MLVELLWSKGFGLLGSTHILMGTTIPASEVLKKLLIGTVRRIAMNVRLSGNSQRDDLIEIIRALLEGYMEREVKSIKKLLRVLKMQLKTLKKTVLLECYTN